MPTRSGGELGGRDVDASSAPSVERTVTGMVGRCGVRRNSPSCVNADERPLSVPPPQLAPGGGGAHGGGSGVGGDGCLVEEPGRDPALDDRVLIDQPAVERPGGDQPVDPQPVEP